mmetsp:Transcript_8483/g.12972  ORF Transcript_8483/g.12972 Transcript_8483/m.12972 type:complete len:295 (-) Transcript_8483:138-1022(-)
MLGRNLDLGARLVLDAVDGGAPTTNQHANLVTGDQVLLCFLLVLLQVFITLVRQVNNQALVSFDHFLQLSHHAEHALFLAFGHLTLGLEVEGDGARKVLDELAHPAPVLVHHQPLQQVLLHQDHQAVLALRQIGLLGQLPATHLPATVLHGQVQVRALVLRALLLLSWLLPLLLVQPCLVEGTLHAHGGGLVVALRLGLLLLLLLLGLGLGGGRGASQGGRRSTTWEGRYGWGVGGRPGAGGVGQWGRGSSTHRLWLRHSAWLLGRHRQILTHRDTCHAILCACVCGMSQKGLA